MFSLQRGEWLCLLVFIIIIIIFIYLIAQWNDITTTNRRYAFATLPSHYPLCGAPLRSKRGEYKPNYDLCEQRKPVINKLPTKLDKTRNKGQHTTATTYST